MSKAHFLSVLFYFYIKVLKSNYLHQILNFLQQNFSKKNFKTKISCKEMYRRTTFQNNSIFSNSIGNAQKMYKKLRRFVENYAIIYKALIFLLRVKVLAKNLKFKEKTLNNLFFLF